jgi:hypothetical protein
MTQPLHVSISLVRKSVSRLRVPSCQLMRVVSSARVAPARRGIDANGGIPLEPDEVTARTLEALLPNDHEVDRDGTLAQVSV